jgi:hypothetical protein
MAILEFEKESKGRIGSNYLKYMISVMSDMMKRYKFKYNELLFLMNVYDLKYFTTKHAHKSTGATTEYSTRKFIISPLVKKGYIDVFLNNGNISPLDVQRFGLKSNKGFARRYAITQLGRARVQQVYRKLEGKIPIYLDGEYDDEDT